MTPPDYADLERLLAELEWQGIETAPKDGTPFLATGLDWGTGPERHITIAVWDRSRPSGPLWAEFYAVEGDERPGALYYLTHWRPLPTPEGDAAARTALPALLEDLRQTRALAERLAAEVERLRDDYRRMAERISADKVGDFVEPAVLEKAMELADKRCNDRHHTRHWWHLYVPEARAALADARSAGLIETAPGHTDLMISPEAIDEVIANAPAKEGSDA